MLRFLDESLNFFPTVVSYKKINFFYLEANYSIVVVFPYIDMNHPQMYMCPPILNPLPPPSPPQPSGLSQCTGFECPVSCIELGLAICFTYGNIHVSMPFSQIIPPSPFPTESKRLFFTSVSLLLIVLHTGSLLPSVYIPDICMNLLCWCFSFWLTSPCIIGSSFVHLVRIDSNMFFFIAE